MAYVFRGINAALDGKTDEDQKQDIFNAQPAVQDQQGGNAPAGEMTKTSTEGELGDTGTSEANAAGAEQDPQQTEVANAEVVKKNLDKVKGPRGIDRVKADIEGAEAGVQAEADNYIKDYSNRNYGLDNSVLDQAVGGDDKAYETAAKRLAENAARADQFDVKTDYDVEDSNLLRNDAGVQELMRRDSDAAYNGGESAFDMMLLRRNKNFNALRDNLVTRQDALRKNVDDYRTSKTDEAQKITDQRFNQATDDIKGYLDKGQSDLVANWKSQVAAEDAAREALRANGNSDFSKAKANSVAQSLMAEYQATGDRQALGQLQYILDNGLDASAYYGVGRDLDAERDYGLVADQAGATRFNRIMALLGRGDSMQAGAGLGEREGFDVDRFRGDVVSNAKTKWEAAEAARIEAERVAAEQAEAARVEAERQAAEAAAAEAARVEQARAASEAAAKAESDRKAREGNRTKRIGGVPIGVTNNQANAYADKSKAVGRAVDEKRLQAGEESKAALNSGLNKVQSGGSNAGGKVSSGAKKAKKKLGL